MYKTYYLQGSQPIDLDNHLNSLDTTTEVISVSPYVHGWVVTIKEALD